MDLVPALRELRVEAESRMRDTCSVTVPAASSGPVDPVTGLEPNTAGTVLISSSPCRLRGWATGASARDAGADRVSVSTPTLSLPISKPRVPVGAVVTITAVPSDDAGGHQRLGLRLRVSSLVVGTDMTAQRMTVEAGTS